MKYGELAKGLRRIYIVGDDGQEREYSLLRGVHINVQEGERVMAGDPLMNGPRNPCDIFEMYAENYRLQGVNINDNHLEVISRQMMRWVRVEEAGGHPAQGKAVLLGIAKAGMEFYRRTRIAGEDVVEEPIPNPASTL